VNIGNHEGAKRGREGLTYCSIDVPEQRRLNIQWSKYVFDIVRFID